MSRRLPVHGRDEDMSVRRKDGPSRMGGRGLVAAALVTFVFSVSFPRFLDAHGVHDPQDDILESIGVDENLGGAVPRDAVFRNHMGEEVRLGDYVTGAPTLLTLNYYTCAQLCPLTLRNLLATVEEVKGIELGSDFRIVTVSINPDDLPETARARAGEIHAEMKGTGEKASQWPFLLGDEKAIGALTAAVGFRYRKSRYLHGVEQSPADLKMALIEATGGNIGESTAMNQVLLFCFRYDPVGKKYALYARNIMKAGGVLTLVLLGGLLLVLWRRGQSKATS
jgi:protein SCO1/2